MRDTFSVLDTLRLGDKNYRFYSLAKFGQKHDIKRLPYSMKIVLENLLRFEDGLNITMKEVEAVANWDAKAEPDTEISFMPARVVLQDFTGVPCVVDLAAMRDAVTKLGGKPEQINPLIPSELVIDHSVQVDKFGTRTAVDENVEIEFGRNGERYSFLRWGQKAFRNFKVVPPRTGIVHQVNLEHLARVVMTKEEHGETFAFPDTVYGTDSHTTMINGIGVLGWGVGGIEAEAAMLGQPSSMLIPQVVGFKLSGKLPEGATATDLVLTVTQMLRKHGVVGKFVEFFGPGLDHLALADRATIANMAPEYGATCGFFPVTKATIDYLRATGREAHRADLVEAYAKAQGMWRDAGAPDAEYSAVLELDMASVKPSLAGPKRPQDRVLLEGVQQNYLDNLKPMADARVGKSKAATPGSASVNGAYDLKDGAVVIAAITSCTNTSNPAVMLGAGLLAQKAVARGLKVKPWVKPSLGPGSLVVTDYLKKAGVIEALE
ncbi:MAG: aconitate hydratase AcnA, partial [Xanthomonadales bacterium]|nr:aconitate hydratase AcnA [Xanthomonadales bacterium]